MDSKLIPSLSKTLEIEIMIKYQARGNNLMRFSKQVKLITKVTIVFHQKVAVRTFVHAALSLIWQDM